MEYEGTIIRPPSEADAIILQVTVGCSYNRCSFCGVYKEKKFRIKSRDEIVADLEFARKYCQSLNTVFLADGDALSMPTGRLVTLLKDIKDYLPWVKKVSSYARCSNILNKSQEELRELKKLGLKRLYLGLESGSDTVLELVNKGADSRQMIMAAQKIKEAGFFLYIMYLLGLGGAKYSNLHARESGRVISAMQPSIVAVLTLMLLENTPLFQEQKEGAFALPDKKQLLMELRLLISEISTPTQLYANHASNYVILKGRLPRDKDRFLKMIDATISDMSLLVPEHQRAL